MPFIDKLRNLTKQKDDRATRVFAEYFHSKENTPDFPFDLAIVSLNQLKENSASSDEMAMCLLEDIIFASLYSTFYEHLIMALKENQQVAVQLIEKFASSEEEREQIISRQTEDHMRFVENMGQCSGCNSCQNHKDVVGIIPYWKKGDLNFFINLYVGMQTIHFGLEQIIFDLIPNNLELVKDISLDDILAFRKYIFNYSEKRIKDH